MKRLTNHRYVIINHWEGADGETYFAMRCKRVDTHYGYCSAQLVVPRSTFWPQLRIRYVGVFT